MYYNAYREGAAPSGRARPLPAADAQDWAKWHPPCFAASRRTASFAAGARRGPDGAGIGIGSLFQADGPWGWAGPGDSGPYETGQRLSA